MDKVLVTGGCGFIGSHVVDKLISEGYDVTVIDNNSSNKQPTFNHNAQYINKDIRDPSIISCFEGIKYVFHLAAYPRVQPSIDDPAEFHDINVNGTHNILDICRKTKPERIVFSSSSSVFGTPKTLPISEDDTKHPMSPYALHKLIGEEYLSLYHELYGLNSVALRYFNVYGDRYPTEGMYVPVVGIFLRQLKAGEPLTITGEGDQSRDFVNVKDVANANYLAAINGKPGSHQYNIGCGNNTPIIKIAKYISSYIKFIEPRYEYKDAKANIMKALIDLQWSPKIDLFKWIDENK